MFDDIIQRSRKELLELTGGKPVTPRQKYRAAVAKMADALRLLREAVIAEQTTREAINDTGDEFRVGQLWPATMPGMDAYRDRKGRGFSVPAIDAQLKLLKEHHQV